MNGVAGLETYLHVAPEEADAVLELAAGMSLPPGGVMERV